MLDTQTSAEKQGSIVVDKNVISSDDGSLSTLTMEAYATGTIVTEQITKPADIIIVVDQSSSMFRPNDDIKLTKNDVSSSHTYPGYYFTNFNQTVGFLMYRDNKWMSYDTCLSRDDPDYKADNMGLHGYFKKYYGGYPWEQDMYGNPSHFTTQGADWDNYLQECMMSWDDVYQNIGGPGSPDDDKAHFWETTTDNWNTFNANGIYITRMGVLYEAMDSFIDTIKESGVDHRVAIVGFGDRNGARSELLINGQSYQKNSTEIQSMYSQAFASVQTEKDQIQASLDALIANGLNTHHDAGLEIANNILEANKDHTDRDKIIIFFSDGEASGQAFSGSTIHQAYIAKSEHNATVYTIRTSKAPKALMDAISSDYPNANGTVGTDVFITGTKDESREYSLSYTSADGLANIFSHISNNVGGTTITLDENAYIQDVVTEYFYIPDDTSSVRAYIVACTGYEDEKPVWDNESRIPVSNENIIISGNTVKVNGFDYAKNFVSKIGREEGSVSTPGDFHGKKILLEIDIRKKEQFLGGNKVPTNTSESGVYDSENKPVASFPIPDTDVKLAAEDIIINEHYSFLGAHILEDVTVHDFDGLMTIYINDTPIALNPSEKDWGLTWEKDYVDIEVVLLDNSGVEHPSGFQDIREDTPFQVRVKIKPKNEGTYSIKEDSEAATIRVFRPELTFTDKVNYYYGQAVPDSLDLQGCTLRWRYDNNGTIYADKAPGMTGELFGMLGTAPQLSDFTYTCTPYTNGTLTKSDVPVDVTVTKIGYMTGTNLNEYVYFNWQSCFDGCGTPITEHQGNANNTPEFYIHPKTCTLTITKTGGDANEPYVFTVFKDGVKYSEASVYGNGTEIISELPVGTYTIMENQQWSWRYEGNDGSAVDLNAATPTGEITCTNEKTKNTWLNGFSEVVENIFGVPHSTGNAS